MMTQTMETAQRVAGYASLEAQHERLLTLVADLLLENQQLSCKVAQLEADLTKNERALKAASAWAGMLF